MIKGDTRVHSLYGSPVSHSLSPVIFNTTFEKLSLNRTYVPFEVSQDKLKDAVEAARALGFDGFNVTMPHKATILDMLDRLERSTEKIGSVNTVARTKSPLSKLRDTDWVFDLAYDKSGEPIPAGRGTISPLEMLVHQAALSYEIWLNETAPFALMRSSLIDHLGKDWK